MAAVYKFKPLNVGRWVIWSLFALVLLVAPLLFTSNLSHTMLAQMGIAIIACLSYNMLLGQGGMLSFGHAVYTGLGSYMAIHALNMISDGKLGIPVSLLPVVGGFSGMGFAILLGWFDAANSRLLVTVTPGTNVIPPIAIPARTTPPADVPGIPGRN